MATEAGDDRPGWPPERPSTADELIRQLVALRHIRGLSQTEVAARMGTSQSALARLESGRTDLRLSTLTRFADALDVDVGFALRSRDSAGEARGPHQKPISR